MLRTSPRARTRPALLWVTVLAVLGLLAAAAPATAGGPKPREFTAMTQNLFLGANLEPLFGATGPDLIIESAKVYDHVVQVDFPSRAEAIAVLVDEERPDLIGLQEVALWRKLQLTEDGSWEPVETIDYLAILLDALADRGLSYRAAAVNVNFSNEAFPLPITFELDTTATLTMRDAILVHQPRRGPKIRVTSTSSGNYEATTLVPSPGDPTQPLPVLRGWSSIDVKQRGRSYRFVNTHLEAWSEADCDGDGRPSLAAPFVRNRQAAELVAELGGSPLPVVLAGDLNADPDNECDAVQIFRDAGFLDAWAEAMPGIPAPTAGQTDDLDNVPSTLDHQIDYVLFNRPERLRAVDGSGVILGEELDDRTPSGLWPSDHAGLAVTLEVTRARRPHGW